METAGTALFVLHPDALPPAAETARDAEVLGWLGWMYPDAPAHRRLDALYRADEPQSAGIAALLADRLWLRTRLLLPRGLPPAYVAGALDQLGSQHARGGVLVVASRAAIGHALAQLVRHGRARLKRRRDAELVELALHDDHDVVEPRSEHAHDGTRGRGSATPGRRARRACRR